MLLVKKGHLHYQTFGFSLYSSIYTSCFNSMGSPHLQHHQLFLDTISKLREELVHTRVAPVDMVFHFMAQSINAEYKNIVGTFKDDVKRVLQFLLYEKNSIPMAIHKAFPDWPRAFIGRVHLSDMRNALVYNIYKTFGRVLDTSHIPYTDPPTTQEIAQVYRNIAHGRPHIVDPHDTERILTLFRCAHIARLALHLLHGTTPADPVETFNSCVGGWVHLYETKGMTPTVFKLFMDVYAYDYAWETQNQQTHGKESDALDTTPSPMDELKSLSF